MVVGIVHRFADGFGDGTTHLGVKMEAGPFPQFLRRERPGCGGRGGEHLFKAGFQLFQEAVDVLVRHHADHPHQVAFVVGIGKRLGQAGSPVRVVAAIQKQQRMAAQHLDAGGQAGLFQAVQDCLVGDVKAVIAPQGQGDFHRHGGVPSLMAARHFQHNLIAAVVNVVFQRAALAPDQVVVFRRDNGGMGVGCRGQNGSHGLGGLVGVADNRAALLDDARLLGGNIHQGISQKLHVIHADAGDRGHQRMGHDVGGIIHAAHAGFQHNNVAGFPGKPEQCHRGDGLKLPGAVPAFQADGVDGVQHLFSQIGQRLGRDHLAVDLEPFPEIGDIGADGQPGLIPRLLQDRRGHYGQGTLAVGARDMDAFEVLFRVAQLVHQSAHPVQCAVAAVGQRVQGFNCLLWGHRVLFPSS